MPGPLPLFPAPPPPSAALPLLFLLLQAAICPSPVTTTVVLVTRHFTLPDRMDPSALFQLILFNMSALFSFLFYPTPTWHSCFVLGLWRPQSSAAQFFQGIIVGSAVSNAPPRGPLHGSNTGHALGVTKHSVGMEPGHICLTPDSPSGQSVLEHPSAWPRLSRCLSSPTRIFLGPPSTVVSPAS